jgi:hypothetical protein
MRYDLTLLGFCLLTWIIVGCHGQTQQPETPPAENVKQADAEAQPPEANGNGDFKLDVDVGQRGVHIETDGPDDKSAVKVDVDPSGDVDVDVGKKPSGEPPGSGG